MKCSEEWLAHNWYCYHYHHHHHHHHANHLAWKVPSHCEHWKTVFLDITGRVWFPRLVHNVDELETSGSWCYNAIYSMDEKGFGGLI